MKFSIFSPSLELRPMLDILTGEARHYVLTTDSWLIPPLIIRVRVKVNSKAFISAGFGWMDKFR